jgi:uncharacterized protein (DUF362 family)
VLAPKLYREGGKSLVAVAWAQEEEERLREALALLGGLGPLGIRGKKVLLKPNVVAGAGPPTTTSAPLIGATVRLLYQEGAREVWVGDMSALMRLPTRANMLRTGIKEASERAGARVLYFEKHDWVRVRLEGTRHVREVFLSEWLYRADVFINMPVLKTHSSAGYSICLKNFVGATHFRQRPYFISRRHWEEVVAELNLAWRPHLNLADGSWVMLQGGPWRGRAEKLDILLAGADMVALDAVGLALIRSFRLWSPLEPGVWRMRQLRRAVQLGLGAQGPEHIRLRFSPRLPPGLRERIEENL